MPPSAPIEQSTELGAATLEVGMVGGASALTGAFARNPMKLLIPKPRGRSVWAYTSSFGGGLVAGDETRLEVNLSEDARCFVGTQASTKIYRNPEAKPCGHSTEARLASGSVLVLAPDPIQAFAGSAYNQRQDFHLAPGASLILVDWLTSGRAARGERWAFSRIHTRTEVKIAGETLLLDSLLLDGADGPLTAPHRLGRFNCLALALVLGEPLRADATRLLAPISAQPVERRATMVESASPLRCGVLIRIAGEHVEAVGQALHRHLSFWTTWLGEDPWSRKF